MTLHRTDILDEAKVPSGKRQTKYTTPSRFNLTVIEDVKVSPEAYQPLPMHSPHPDYANNGLILCWQGPVKAANNQVKVIRVYSTPNANEDWYNYAVKYSGDVDAAPIYIRSYIQLRETYVPLAKGLPLTGVVLLTVTNPGSGYTPGTPPTVTITGGGGSNATASPVMDETGTQVIALELTTEGRFYTSNPDVNFSGGSGTGVVARAYIQPAGCYLVKEETEKLDQIDPQSAGLFIKVTRIYETLPGPWLPITRYDNDLGYVYGQKRAVLAAGQTEQLDATSRTSFEAREGSGIVSIQTQESWTDGISSPFPIQTSDTYKDAFHEPAKRGSTDRYEQIIVAQGDEESTLTRLGGITTKIQYEPYPPNPFLLKQVTERWVTPIVNDRKTTSEFGGAILDVTERTDEPGAQVPDSGYLVVSSRTETKNPHEQTKITEAFNAVLVPEIDITNPGSGYTTPPTVGFGSGTTGVQATAQADISPVGQLPALSVNCVFDHFGDGNGAFYRIGRRATGAWVNPATSGAIVITTENAGAVFGGPLDKLVDRVPSDTYLQAVSSILSTSYEFDLGAGNSLVCNRLAYRQRSGYGSPTNTFDIQASPTGLVGSWIDLGVVNVDTGISVWTDSGPIVNTTAYRYYRIIVAPGVPYFMIGELELYGQLTIAATGGHLGLTSIDVLIGGTNYSTVPNVVISGGGGSGGTAVAVVVGGIVTQINVTNSGTYATAPTVTIDSPVVGGGPGTPTATAYITFGVDHVNVTAGGNNYLHAPAISFVGDGAGAVGYAVLGHKLLQIIVTNPGSGYTTNPTVLITGGGGSGAAAVVVRSYGLASVTVTAPGSGYTSDPIVTATGGGGQNASFQAVRGLPLLNVNIITGGSGYTAAPTVAISAPGGGGTTAVGAATLGFTVASITITAQGTGYSSAPIVVFAGGNGGGAAAVATLLGYSLASILVNNQGSGYTSPPTVTIMGDGNGATALAGMGIGGAPAIVAAGTGYAVNDIITIVGGTSTIAAQLKVTSIGGGGTITGVSIQTVGKYTVLPANPVSVTGGAGTLATFTLAWLVVSLDVTAAGSGFHTPPTVVISGGGGTGAAGSSILSAGQTIGITITNPGVGYETAPAMSFVGGGGTGLAATAVLATTGSVKKVTLSVNGTNYSANASVVFTGGGGQGAAAVGVRNLAAGGTIAAVNVLNAGTGYTSPPTLTFSVAGGTGAAATAVLVAGGVIAGFIITNPGSGYTDVPTVVITGGGGTGLTARAILDPNANVSSVVVTSPGGGYSTPPTVVFQGGAGTGAAATAVLQPTGSVTKIILNTPGGPFTVPPTVTLTGGGGTGATAVYVIADASWPTLIEWVTDPLTSVRVKVTKKVVRSLGQPGYIAPPPPPAYVDDKPYDIWRTLRLISEIDPNSLPPPLNYTTSQHVAFPSVLLSVTPLWDEATENHITSDLKTNTGGTSVVAAVHGTMKVLKKGGFRGGAIAHVEEVYFIGAPPDAAVPAATIIKPSSGTAILKGQRVTQEISGTTVQQPINPITGQPANPGDTIGHNADGTPIILGGYAIPQVPTSSGNSIATTNQVVDLNDVLTPGLETTETHVVSQDARVSGTENFVFGTGVPLATSAVATGTFLASIPASCPADISAGMSILAEVYVERQRFNLFLRRIVRVIAPGDCNQAIVLPLIPGLILWLKADILSLADGAQIAGWPDSSGHNNDASQATGAQQPILHNAVINGLPIARFDGVNDEMLHLARAGSIGDPVTVFVVGASAVASGSQMTDATFLTFGNGGLEARFSSTADWGSGTGFGVPHGDAGEGLAANQFNILELTSTQFPVAGIYLYRNGVQKGFWASDYAWAISEGSVGSCTGSPRRYLNGDIAECLVYTGVLSTVDRQRIEDYLSAKYNIPVTH